MTQERGSTGMCFYCTDRDLAQDLLQVPVITERTGEQEKRGMVLGNGPRNMI